MVDPIGSLCRLISFAEAGLIAVVGGVASRNPPFAAADRGIEFPSAMSIVLVFIGPYRLAPAPRDAL